MKYSRLYNKISKTSSSNLFLLYSMSAITQCCFAVSIILADSQTSWVLILLLIASTFETLVPCVAGDNLRNESELLASSIGFCNWVDQNKQFKRDLIFFINSAQKPLQLLAGSYIPCSMNTFVNLQKLAYSIFVLFK